MKLPSRRRYADYYREIKNPISLSRIRSKLAREDYGNLSELASDLSLMFENAKRYNRPDSKLFKDAVKLQKVMQTKVQELLADDEVTSIAVIFAKTYYHHFFRVLREETLISRQNVPKDALVLTPLQEPHQNCVMMSTIYFGNDCVSCIAA